MRTFMTISAALLLLLFTTAATVEQELDGISGFTKAGAAAQHALEVDMHSMIDPMNARSILKELTSRSNMAGTPGGRANAEFVRDLLEQYGYSSRIEPFYIYLPWPNEISIDVLGEEPYRLIPGEHAMPEDHTWPPFNGFSPSGTVEGPVVFANYGRAEDFEALENAGVTVRGSIVIARYGRLFRGSKAWEAEKRGAAGLILYSDPADDGYTRGDVWPEGPMRPDDAIQRGSIYYMFNTPGDPLTPMEPAVKDAQRINPAEAGLPAIPTIPIGYGDAHRILAGLGGDEVPGGWQGGLPFRYHLGGDLVVRLNVDVDYDIREVWNTVAVLPGTEHPDQWVIIGCHRDAWVRGAIDPHSGNATMLEAARVIAEAAKKHGGPKRSIMVCTWDAEEFGVMGSIEWVESMRSELEAKAVLYVNCDSMISGDRFGASATPTLREAFQELLADVEDVHGGSILTNWFESRGVADPTREQLTFGSMGGGGSDHTGFYHHIGVPCAGAGFYGRNGVYHSAYDTFEWMDRFGDPGFKSHAAGARLISSLLTRFSNADILPYSPSGYAEDLHQRLEQMLKNNPDALGNWKDQIIATLSEIEGLGHAFLRERDRQLARLTAPETWQELNQVLLGLERTLTHPEGIAGRPWNRNLIFATDKSNGYGAELLPGLQEEPGNNDSFEKEAEKITMALSNYRDATARALAILYAHR